MTTTMTMTMTVTVPFWLWLFLGSIESMLATSHFAHGVVSLARLAHLTSPDPRSPSSPRFLLLNIVRSRAKQMPRAWALDAKHQHLGERVPGLALEASPQWRRSLALLPIVRPSP
jgi:hypothetical protein